MKNFFRQINNAVVGGLSVLIFFVLGFIWWIFDADTLVPLWVLSVVVIICYLICIIVFGICSMQKETSVYRLPKIKSIIKLRQKYVFVVEKNDLFNQGAYATVCFQEDENSLEVVLGLGYVESITTEGCLQVVIERVSSSSIASNIYKKIENKNYYRNAIKIKPSTNKELIEEAYYHE